VSASEPRAVVQLFARRSVERAGPPHGRRATRADGVRSVGVEVLRQELRYQGQGLLVERNLQRLAVERGGYADPRSSVNREPSAH